MLERGGEMARLSVSGLKAVVAEMVLELEVLLDAEREVVILTGPDAVFGVCVARGASGTEDTCALCDPALYEGKRGGSVLESMQGSPSDDGGDDIAECSLCRNRSC